MAPRVRRRSSRSRFHLTKIHGERVKGWEVRVSERLACAIDAALLEGIKDCFSRTKNHG